MSNRFRRIAPKLDPTLYLYNEQEIMPRLDTFGQMVQGLQQSYDFSQEPFPIPKHIQADAPGVQEYYVQPLKELQQQALDAFTSGDVGAGLRAAKDLRREIFRSKQPGGAYYEAEKRLTDFTEQQNMLQNVYLDPKSPQYNPRAYKYYQGKLKEGVSPFYDAEAGTYGAINAPQTAKLYSDEDETKYYMDIASKLPADQYAIGPEFASKLSGLTIGDVMSQGLTQYVDKNKLKNALIAATGDDIIQSSYEKQRIAGQEPDDWMKDGQFNPNNPLGRRLQGILDSFAYERETLSHRFIPSNLGGEGRPSRTRSGDKIESTQTPNVMIIQNPVTSEVKSDNQLAEDGTILEEDEGLAIFQNTERLYNQKVNDLGNTIRQSFQDKQLAPETLDEVFFKYLPDTQDEFGVIGSADYFPLASEVFNDEQKYGELVSSIQQKNPGITEAQAKLQADQLITQTDYLYMGINEDLAYYKQVQEEYKDRYADQKFNEVEKELLDFNFGIFKADDFTGTKYFEKEIIDPLTDPNVIFEGIHKSPINAYITEGVRDGIITEAQARDLRTQIERYRNRAENKISPPTPEDLDAEMQKQWAIDALEKGAQEEIVARIAINKINERQRETLKGDLEKDIKDNATLQSLMSVRASKLQEELYNEVNNYDDEDIHSEISQELIPNMKRNMPVLNYLSAGFDFSSTSQYKDLHPVKQLQIDGRGLQAKVSNDGELQDASNLVESANIYRVNPGQMFEKDGFVFQTVKDNNKILPKEKKNIAGVEVMGFVKAPDDKIYYYGRLQTVGKKEIGEKVTKGDYVYFNYSEQDNLTKKYYNALGLNDNIFEDLRFFNKQLDMDRIQNKDANPAIDTYTDTRFIEGEKLTIMRNKKSDGTYGYKLKIGDQFMFNNQLVNDTELGLALNQLKRSKKSDHRGDRHNNPAAFTTDVAKQAGLVEGEDYVVGDPFETSTGGTAYTARLLKDPIFTTIKVIDKIGFYTADGKPRWSHTQMSKEEWDQLPYQRKLELIKEMERKEGGSLLQS